MLNPKDSIALTQALIRCPSVTPEEGGALRLLHGILQEAGFESHIVRFSDSNTPDVDNLYARIGIGAPCLMFAGHTDVVPVDGQAWTYPPFELSEENGRLYGRGTADMKGFCAAAIATMIAAGERAKSGRPLAVPLHLALSYDEEIGCMGVRSLINLLEAAPHRPRFCIVGEPTSMQVATGHKGKIALRATCIGREGHSALAPMALNALHLAADFVGVLRGVQARVAAEGMRDGDYDVPYTTLHVGKLAWAFPGPKVTEALRQAQTVALAWLDRRFRVPQDAVSAVAS